jgi:hypothetical protein
VNSDWRFSFTGNTNWSPPPPKGPGRTRSAGGPRPTGASSPAPTRHAGRDHAAGHHEPIVKRPWIRHRAITNICPVSVTITVVSSAKSPLEAATERRGGVLLPWVEVAHVYSREPHSAGSSMTVRGSAAPDIAATRSGLRIEAEDLVQVVRGGHRTLRGVSLTVGPGELVGRFGSVCDVVSCHL